MARPVKAHAETTRRRVLAAACALFAERGPGRSSVREIARRAGVTLATVHHYFGSKDQLHRACVDAMYAELEDLKRALQPALVAGGTPAEAFGRAVVETYHFARIHQGAVRLLNRQILDQGHVPADRRDDYLLPFLDDGARLLTMLTGRPLAELRLALQSVIFMVVRYALTPLEELRLLVGADDAQSAQAALESHLIESARRMLLA